MARRAFITGGSGFVGQWLCRALLDREWTVIAGTLEGAPRTSLVLSERQRSAIEWVELDMQRPASVDAAVRRAAPDAVAHLAGIAFPPEATADPGRAHDVNAQGVARLLTALAAAGHRTRVLVVGSAEQYGPHAVADYPLRESAALTPVTVYGRSKVEQERLALETSGRTGVPIVLTRSFNHSGIGHADNYLLPSLVRRARELPPRGGTLRIGNSTPVRDYLHVGDVVDAYLLLLERGAVREAYNVSSGTGTSVRELAERVLSRLGIAADITEDPALVRPSEMPVLIGDNGKLRAATGWTPTRTIDDIIDDLIHAAPR